MEKCFCDEAFEAAMEIVSSTMEGEAEVSLDAKGAEQVMEYFRGIYSGMCQLFRETDCCEDNEEDEDEEDEDEEDEEEDEDEEEKKPARSGCFAVKKTDAGFSFVLKAANGEIIAVSEVYKTRAACMKGIASVKKNAPDAPITE